jgi:Asp-tRNA(Asn)/Glu-tRNA(Gln) amidotransferase B subunit
LQQYVKQHNLDISTLKYKQDKINQFIACIVDDKMSITAASKKLDIPNSTGCSYYHRYLKNHNLYIPSNRITQDQINKLIRYILIDKMTIKAASEKVNMSYKSGKKYYRQYLTDQKRDVPTRIAPASQK